MRRAVMGFVAVVCGLAGMPALAAGPNAFEFVAIGDMPYKIPDDYPAVDRLIAAVNARKPAFTLHVGDTKAGSGPCTDEVLRKAFEQMQTVEGPLVYTIGDNEWTDCHRKDAGGFDPRERLKTVREIFFAKPGQSLGKAPMPLESQGLISPEFSTYVENTRFEKNGVVVVGVHVPGSNNGFETIDPVASAQEFAARDKANVAWINASFDKAVAGGARALVIFHQADYDEVRLADRSLPRHSGFNAVVNAIEAGARRFGRPVLLIHGDEHYFSVGPLNNAKGKPIPGVTNLMTWGETEIHGVVVSVDPDAPGVFGFSSLIVPENIRK